MLIYIITFHIFFQNTEHRHKININPYSYFGNLIASEIMFLNTLHICQQLKQNSLTAIAASQQTLLKYKQYINCHCHGRFIYIQTHPKTFIIITIDKPLTN